MRKGKLLENLKEKISCKMNINSALQDYHKFSWKGTELFKDVAESALVVAVLSYFFYRSIFAVLPLSVIGILYFKKISLRREKRRIELLTTQFKECILSVISSLRAGYAVENAFLESRTDMKILYGENSLIYQELELIRRGMILNITLEELLQDLAQRSGSDEILQFSQIFFIAKRGGGNLPQIIQTSAELISKKIETKQEIDTILSGRKMEQNIMKLMPFAILAYVGSTYQGYFDELYFNLKGVALMSLCLVVYVGAFIMGDMIMEKTEKQML